MCTWLWVKISGRPFSPGGQKSDSHTVLGNYASVSKPDVQHTPKVPGLRTLLLLDLLSQTGTVSSRASAHFPARKITPQVLDPLHI